jgi:hypothetical protein
MIKQETIEWLLTWAEKRIDGILKGERVTQEQLQTLAERIKDQRYRGYDPDPADIEAQKQGAKRLETAHEFRNEVALATGYDVEEVREQLAGLRTEIQHYVGDGTCAHLTIPLVPKLTPFK